MSFRTLRAANQGLYLVTSLFVLAACAYALLREPEPWQAALAAAAALATIVWGGYYVSLRFQVDAEGVSRRAFFTCRRILWKELTSATCERESGAEMARCTIRLASPSGDMEISSDLLPLDAVEELAAEMRAAGVLPQEPGATAAEED